MRAYSTASGAVMFVPDEIERVTAQQQRMQAKTASVKYIDLIDKVSQDEPETKRKPMGFAQRLWDKLKKAA